MGEPVRIALEVWGADLDTVVETCRIADSLGIDAFYYGEAPGPLNLDCWTTLSALAAVTDRIRLGPVIANVLPTYRSSLLLAKQAATVALISRGRLDFRTGVGADRAFGRRWWEPYGVDYPDHRRRAGDLEQALRALRAFWAGDDGPGDLGIDHPPIPITVAASGETGIAIAHRWAERWELSYRTAAQVEQVIEGHDDPSHVDGRCPLAVSLEVDGFIGSDRAGAGRVLDAVRVDRAGEDVDVLVDRALVGTPERVAEQIVRLAEVGVGQLVVALHDPHDLDAVTALAEARRLVHASGA